jgi:hypothetical protein
MKRCHKCGAVIDAEKVSRRDECSGCGSDLRVCLNCAFYERAGKTIAWNPRRKGDGEGPGELLRLLQIRGGGAGGRRPGAAGTRRSSGTPSSRSSISLKPAAIRKMWNCDVLTIRF